MENSDWLSLEMMGGVSSTEITWTISVGGSPSPKGRDAGMEKQKKMEKLRSTLLVLIHFTVKCLPRIQTNHVFQCPDLTLYFLHFWIPKLSLIFFTFSSIHPHLTVPCFSPFIHLHSKYVLIFTFLNTSLTKIVSALKKQSHLYFFNEFQWLQFNWFNLPQNGGIKIHFQNISLYLRTWYEVKCADVLYTYIIPHIFQYIYTGSLNLIDINLRSQCKLHLATLCLEHFNIFYCSEGKDQTT